MKISDESKIGIFAVFTLVILILGFNLLKGKNILKSTNTYYAYYDNINGLQESNPVVLRGYRVGKVYDIEVDDKTNKIKVSMVLKSEIKIPVNSVAKITDLDVLGAKAVEIIPSDNPQIARHRDVLIGKTAITLSQAVDNVVNPVVEKINKTLKELNQVLENGGTQNLEEIIANLNVATENLSKTTKKINDYRSVERLNEILKNISFISKTLKDNNDEINHFIQNMSAVSDTLAAAQLGQVIEESRQTIERINYLAERINKGEGSVGMLVNNDSLYIHLENASKNLNLLIEDLRKNPSQYVHFSVFGKKVKKNKTSK